MHTPTAISPHRLSVDSGVWRGMGRAIGRLGYDFDDVDAVVEAIESQDAFESWLAVACTEEQAVNKGPAVESVFAEVVVMDGDGHLHILVLIFDPFVVCLRPSANNHTSLTSALNRY